MFHDFILLVYLFWGINSSSMPCLHIQNTSFFSFSFYRNWNILCTYCWRQGYMAIINDPYSSWGWMFCSISKPVLSKERLSTSPWVWVFRCRWSYTRFCCLCWRQCHHFTIRDCSGWTQLRWGGSHLSRSWYVASTYVLNFGYNFLYKVCWIRVTSLYIVASLTISRSNMNFRFLSKIKFGLLTASLGKKKKYRIWPQSLQCEQLKHLYSFPCLLSSQAEHKAVSALDIQYLRLLKPIQTIIIIIISWRMLQQ